MILLDANILLYAYNFDSPHHSDAKSWLEGAMDRKEDIGLAWSVIHAFLRLATNPASYPQTLSIQDATDVIEEFLSHSNVEIVQPPASHWPTLRRLLVEMQATHRFVMDADLAALAIEHGAALCTNDRDFSRFPGLKIINPISRQ